MTEIGLVSCTKTKRNEPTTPRELYAPSTLFTKAQQYCEGNHDEWYVLSAEHHLLHPDGSAIDPYDTTLTDATTVKKREWAANVYEDMEAEGLLQTGATLVFHAGKAYYEELLPLLERGEVNVQIPLEGLAIGERLAWYNERL